MHFRSTRIRYVLATILAAAAVGCAGTQEKGRPTSSRTSLAEEWAEVMYDLGRLPVLPPTEDVYVGDVYVYSELPNFASAETASGLRTAATPRWKTLEVLGLLEDEYRVRPSWPRSDQPVRPAAPGDAPQDETSSIFRAGRVPVRHRIVGLRPMVNMTIGVADLEPFIPVEVAPLIDGPATPETLGVSLQAGDAETYALSTNAMLELLVDPAAGEDGEATFELKEEHRRNLPLVADQTLGRVYLVAITEVLYIRSMDATVRSKRDDPEEVETTAHDEPEEEPAEGEAQGREPDAEEDEVDPSVAAILRANAMNEALGETGLTDRSGGTVRVVMATDDALTLRRRWPYPLAVAIRGIVLEVDVNSGRVIRVGPLGVALPALPPPPKKEPEPAPTE